MDDAHYGTPQDAYFSYLTKRKQEVDKDGLKEYEVLQNLGLGKVLPPYYNPATGKFEIQNKDLYFFDSPNDTDPIQQARVQALTSKNTDSYQEASEDVLLPPKHQKKDY